MARALHVWATLLVLALPAGCDRERSGGGAGASPASTGATPNAPPPRVPGSALIPGGEVLADALESPYRRDVNAIRDGERLYHWYNCSGCHANGGGGMGPPLMDERWIYGSRPANLFDTIYEGRPGGMPAFGSKIPQDQIWKLVAYIEAMGE
jgi:cytochrome c oxidase cbb3-type subunit 3